MASAIYGEDRLADKTPDKKLSAAAEARKRPLHPMIIRNELGSATLGECVAAMQPHDYPFAGLIALSEMGLIAFDREPNSTST